MARAKGGASAMQRGAEVYARRGWRVFPIVPRAKNPLTGAGGFKTATSDVEEVRRIWTRTPDANVGLPCGLNGLWVLDLDTAKYPTTLAEFEGLAAAVGGDIDEAREAAVVVQTMSGGEHWYYLQPDEPRVASVRALHGHRGIDTRGDGGYVVAPPSYAEDDGRSGTYRWIDYDEELLDGMQRAPAWLEKLAGGEGTASTVRRDRSVGDLWHEKTYDGEGRFDAVWRMSGHLLATVVDVDTAWTMLRSWNQTNVEPPLDEARLRRLFDGIARRDEQRHPERVAEREQMKEVEELLGPVSPPPPPEGLEALANGTNGSSNGAPARKKDIAEKAPQRAAHAAREGGDEEEQLDEDAALGSVVEEARAAGFTGAGGRLPAGYALEDPEKKKRALEALRTLLGVDLCRWIRYAGETERYVMILDGGEEVEIGDSSALWSAWVFARKLYDSCGEILTKYAMKKGFTTILRLLYAVREDLDGELTLRDEALDIVRLAASRRGGGLLDWRRGDDVDPKAISRQLQSRNGWREADSVVLPWSQLRRCAEQENRAATDSWIRARMQALGGQGKRIARTDPVNGRQVRQRCYVLPWIEEMDG